MRAAGKNSGKKILRKSALNELNAVQQTAELGTADIVLGDTMGEMFTYYAIADIVLMGGTWLPYGGQNFLEPMALGKQVWVGPSVYNFEYLVTVALNQALLKQFDTMFKAISTLGANDGKANFDTNGICSFLESFGGVSKKLIKTIV